MTYIRHRSRMVQESVFQDLKDTLIATRWLVGTTVHDVKLPGGGSAAPFTCDTADVFPLAKGKPITLLNWFPESKEQGEPGAPTEPNTFAVDNGRPGDTTPMELGTNSLEQPYLFNFAFYAVTDAVADAVMSDLKDRYEGRIVRGEAIALYDWVGDPDASDPVVWMDVESFRYSRDLDNVTPAEVHLFFAELTITDYIETG